MSNPVSKLPPTPGLSNALLQAGEAANDNVVTTAAEEAAKRWTGPAASEVESFASKFLRIGTTVGSKLLFYAQFLELEGDTPHHDRAALPAIDKPPEGKTVMQWFSEMAEAEKIAARIAALRSELELAKKQGQTARVHALNAKLSAIYAQIETISSAASVQGRYLQAMASAGAAATTSGDANSGIDPNNLDRSVKPSDDFYRFVNGGWLATNPIPPSEPAWGSFGVLRLANQDKLQAILEEAAKSNAASGTTQQKIGDFYASGMDEATLNQAGAAPLVEFLAKIDAIQSPADLQNVLAWFHSHKIGGVFGFLVDLDAKQSDRFISILDQGGLGLPNRDYYSRDDEKSVQLREAYVAHVAATFRLLGDSEVLAHQKAANVMAIESALAQSSLNPVERRDLTRQYNKLTFDQLQALAPSMNWQTYFKAIGANDVNEVVVTHPDFFRAMDGMLAQVPVDQWKAYLTWHLVNNASDYMGDSFVNQKFSFFGTTLNGTPELKPRWKRVLDQTDALLGDALGQAFVERYFPAESKQRVNVMVDYLVAAFRDRIQTRPWMGDATKTKALEKLDVMARKLGFPDKWKDYSSVAIYRESYLGNALAAMGFEFALMVNKLGKPVDRAEWAMTTPTVNAYYEPNRNEMVFPAGILQPPFFNPDADDAVNFGAIGAVIGHEITHGFDDQGGLYDKVGNMENWWTDADKVRFEALTAQVVNQFNDFVAIGDLHVNGQLTLGENVADLGGLVMAYYALQKSLEGKTRVMIDGFTPEQRLFMGWAQIWRISFRDKTLENYVRTNVHSPGRFRVVGPMSNMPEFYEAWGVEEGDAMCRPPEERTEIW